ncbi:MAG: ABC transporter substrate-binding protein [Blastochloris sp.]|nr:ABC transporter substrate-binding protein [Blastochloris sp.]
MRRNRSIWSALLLLVLLAACGTPTPGAATSESVAATQAPAPTTASAVSTPAPAAATGFPVTIENCGNTLTFERPPERILMTYNPMVELVVALGLADRIVGVTFGKPVNPPLELADEINRLNWMGIDGYASKEVQITANPDIVIGTYSFDFGDSAGPTQDEWRALGAEVFLPTSACSPERVDTSQLEDAYTDILALGQIFGVEARAEAVVQDMRDRISAVQERVKDRTPVPAILTTAYNGQEPIYVYTGGLTDEFFALAGGSNLFSGSEQAVFEVSKEAFAAQEPAVVLFFEEGDRPDEEEQQRAAFYTDTFPNMEAIKNGRTAILDAWALQLGIRIADGVEQMARALHPEAFQ